MRLTTHVSTRSLCGLAALLLLSLLSVSCSSGVDAADRAALEKEVLEWREKRRASLMAPTGFLNLAGLFWLDEKAATFGSAPDNDLVFPAAADAHIGRFRLTDDGVVMEPREGVEVYSGDVPVGETLIKDDTTEDPVMITHGSLAWTVIKRDGRYAVRLRDFEHPALASFPPLEYFAIDPSWQVDATLERYDEPRQVAAREHDEELHGEDIGA